MRYDQPISILHLITTLDTGGAEMMLYRLLSKMERKSFESKVISLTEIGPVGKKIQALGIRVQALEMQRYFANPVAVLRLVRSLRQNPANVVQTWMYHADLLGVLVSRLVETPNLVWTIRCSSVPFNRYRPLTGLIVKLCSLLSAIPDAIIVNSSAGIRHHVKLGYTPGRMHLIPNGFDVERFRPDSGARFSIRTELGLPEDAIIIGLVARWDSLKGHSTFVQAASLIARESNSIYFLLIGKGVTWETAKLATLIRDTGFQDRMILLGQRDDMPRLTAAFDIACSSSITEGFPTTIGEAMACGVPCVVTDVGDSAAIVGETGRVVQRGDATAFAHACKELIALGPDGRRELGCRARTLIISQYGLSGIARRYENLYTNLAGSSHEMRSN